MIQLTTHRKREPSPERLSKIDSVLAHVEEITTRMRHHAIAHGEHYLHAEALKRACTLLEPPIGLSTFYRYRVLHSRYHLSEARNWLDYLTSLQTGRSKNNDAKE